MIDRFSRLADTRCPACNSVQPIRTNWRVRRRFRSGHTVMACLACGVNTRLDYIRGAGAEAGMGVMLILALVVPVLTLVTFGTELSDPAVLYPVVFLGALGLMEMAAWGQTLIIKNNRRVVLA